MTPLDQPRKGGLGATLVRATFGSAGLRIVGMVLSFLVGVQLARLLGVDDYGVYGLAMSIVTLLSVPTQFGVPQLLTREIARTHAAREFGKLRGALGWGDRVIVVASLMLAAGTAVVLLLWSERDRGLESTLLWGIPLLPLLALGNVRGAALRGLQRIVLGQAPSLIIRPAVLSGALLVATLSNLALQPDDAMALNVLAAGVAFVMGAWWLRVALPAGVREAAAEKSDERRWLASAFPMALTEGMRVLQGHLAVLLLGVFCAAAQVALFRVSLSTSAVVATPISLLNVVAAPIMARLHAEKDMRRLVKMSPLVAWAMLAGVLLLSLPLALLGRTLLGVAFGQEFEASLPSLLLLCAGQAASAALGANSVLLNMSGNERRVTRAFSVALVVNVVAAFALIPTWQTVGAAVATVLAILVWNAIMWRDAYRILHVDTSIFATFSHLGFREKP